MRWVKFSTIEKDDYRIYIGNKVRYGPMDKRLRRFHGNWCKGLIHVYNELSDSMDDIEVGGEGFKELEICIDNNPPSMRQFDDEYWLYEFAKAALPAVIKADGILHADLRNGVTHAWIADRCAEIANALLLVLKTSDKPTPTAAEPS